MRAPSPVGPRRLSNSCSKALISFACAEPTVLLKMASIDATMLDDDASNPANVRTGTDAGRVEAVKSAARLVRCS